MLSKGGNLISVRELSRPDFDAVFKRASSFEAPGHTRTLQGKVVASLFYEPSTRTRLSSETAAQRLGARVIGFSGTEGTSVQKGETLSDTIRMVDAYADAIVLRHPLEGSARRAAEVATHPVVNGGDGANQHPTQTLLDLYTIQKHFGKIDGLTVAIVGDLKYGRTVHSLLQALNHYDVRIKLISHPLLRMPTQFVRASKNPVEERAELVVDDCDVIYCTRIQKERFADAQEYEKVRGAYLLSAQTLEGAKPNALVMHPLPRVDEIATDVDVLPQAGYFAQAANGVPVRMAVLDILVNG